MEATLILFGPAATPSDPAELAEACGTFRKKVERLLGGAKYKPIQVWLAETHDGVQGYRPLASLFGKPIKVKGTVDKDAWPDTVVQLLPAKPSKRKPLFATIYSTDTLAVSPAWAFETKHFDHQSEDRGLAWVYETEFRPCMVADLAVFSATANPTLRSLGQAHIDSLAPTVLEPAAGSKGAIRGLALSHDRLSATVSSAHGTIWLLELADGLARLHEVGRRGVLQALEYKRPDPAPPLMDPANPIVFQLFRLILLLDASEQQLEPALLRNFEVLLSSFVDKALKEDVQLFPVYTTHPAARALSIRRAVGSLRRLDVQHKELRAAIDKALRSYDAGDKLSGKAKKPKPQPESPVDPALLDFRMRPYLELAASPTPAEMPAAKEDSLFNTYWRMREMSQGTLVAKYKRFWE